MNGTASVTLKPDTIPDSFAFIVATATVATNGTSPFSGIALNAKTPYTVYSTADKGAGSLRQAIKNANNPAVHDAAGPVTIDFNFMLPIPSPVLPFVMRPVTALPHITLPVFVDGTTQKGFDPTTNVPVIQINGSNLAANDPSPDGLTLGIGSQGSTIRGLSICNFLRGAGIHVLSDGDTIQGNYVGTDLSGSSAGPGNLVGIMLDGGVTSTTIGGVNSGAISSSPARNLISGNLDEGIKLDASDGNLIVGNLIGTKADGTPFLGNGVGIHLINARGNTIGLGGTLSTLPDYPFNVIAGNDSQGIWVEYSAPLNSASLAAQPNLIQGDLVSTNGGNGIELDDSVDRGSQFQPDVIRADLVGTNSGGTSTHDDLGRSIGNGKNGILLHGGEAHIEGNVISGNGIAGIDIESQDGETAISIDQDLRQQDRDR